MKIPDCTFSLLAGPADAGFLRETLQHLLRMCAFPFREKIIVADDLPNRSVPEDASYRFSRLLEELQRDNIITQSVLLSNVAADRLSVKHFGSRVSVTRDHRGVPLFGWIAGIEQAHTDFVAHFDSDILLHQAKGHNWIEGGMALIEQDPSVMFVAPLPGPPTADGRLRGQTAALTLDSHGNFRFKTFSSRRFLVSKRRFEAILPTPLRYTSAKRRLLMRLGAGNALQPWEQCVSCALQESTYYRVYLRSPLAWALHCPDHGDTWCQSLPAVIQRVEEGTYPAEQAGNYDLVLPSWTDFQRPARQANG